MKRTAFVGMIHLHAYPLGHKFTISIGCHANKGAPAHAPNNDDHDVTQHGKGRLRHAAMVYSLHL